MASEALESLLFKATNPSNKIEDVNTIKKFCDEVQATKEGPAIACKLMAHKIQSPQEREAIQTLAVLEACVKSCGEAFHVEVGKFKFLNEMIKLVSPRYLASKTPEHIQKKIIEMLFLWTKDLEKETKIREAYEMLKKQGIVKEDPAYMGEAVFASSLPPRADTPLTEPQTKELKKLLQSKSPEDLEKANKIIKGMVKEDERKMDLLTRRSTELIMVNNNSKLLNEMLDHFDRAKATAQELELLQDLQESCEKMQPKLFRLASDTDDNDDSITEILQASDDLTRVLDRYKMVVLQGKPDIIKRRVQVSSPPAYSSDSLLDLGPIPEPLRTPPKALDDDILGLGSGFLSNGGSSTSNNDLPSPAPQAEPTVSHTPVIPSIDDLLNGSPLDSSSEPSLFVTPTASVGLNIRVNTDPFAVKMEEKKASRQRGLEELDFLGETAIKSHLSARSPQFEKRVEKVPMSSMINKQQELDLTASLPPATTTAPLPPPVVTQSEAVNAPEAWNPPVMIQVQAPAQSIPDLKLTDLEVPISSIKPGTVPPLTLQDCDDGISIVLHFGKEQPRPHVSAVVVTTINKSADPLTDFELRAVVPKGCKVKLQAPSGRDLPPHNPFVPPPAITQVMLISNPKDIAPVSLKYVLTFVQDGDAQTEMGEVKALPLPHP